MSDATTTMLRHTLATLAYRGAKVLRGAPAGFAEFKAGPSTRTPGQILAHLGDLLEWALSQANGKEAWHDTSTSDWEQGTARFFATLEALDQYLASGQPIHASADQMFQGPIADALTHVGQIALLRRLAGGPVRAENYYKAEIAVGRVGADQTTPRREFD